VNSSSTLTVLLLCVVASGAALQVCGWGFYTGPSVKLARVIAVHQAGGGCTADVAFTNGADSTGLVSFSLDCGACAGLARESSAVLYSWKALGVAWYRYSLYLNEKRLGSTYSRVPAGAPDLPASDPACPQAPWYDPAQFLE
jgi:hypothetical protein